MCDMLKLTITDVLGGVNVLICYFLHPWIEFDINS